MEKILVTVHVPSMQNEYEILIPSFLQVSQIIDLLKEAVDDLSQHRYTSKECTLLFGKEQKTVFDPGKTIAEQGIRHGDHLYLL